MNWNFSNNIKTMNLLEFISCFKKPSEIERVVLGLEPDLDIELADVYLEKELNIYSNIRFFNAEEIEGKLEMEIEGKKYINLFPLDLLKEIYEDYANLVETDLEIANSIMSYRVKDA